MYYIFIVFTGFYSYDNMTALAAKYDIYNPLWSTASFEIKLHIWK